jgi:predicted alpha/beta-hydrolase family hydrolase
VAATLDDEDGGGGDSILRRRSRRWRSLDRWRWRRARRRPPEEVETLEKMMKMVAVIICRGGI